MRKNILITTSTFGQYDDRPLKILEDAGYQYTLNPYGHKVSEEELLNIIDDSIGMVAGTENLSGNVLNKIPQIKAIARCGVGLDNVDLEAAKEQSVIVTNTTGSISTAVAELTVGLILSLLRKTSLMDRQLHEGVWSKRMGNLLSGKKVGIIGFGRIGQTTAALLKPFNVDISYCDVNAMNNSDFERKTLDELLTWSDIICLHLSKPKESSCVIGEREINLMKNGAWIVNVARGGLINENVLCEALKNGKISGAAIDVFEDEPYEGPLKNLEQCILTPHIGSYAKETRIDMEIEAVNNLIESLRSVS